MSARSAGARRRQVTDGLAITALMREHLPDGPATSAQFVRFFQSLLLAAGASPTRSRRVALELVAWRRDDGSVHHHVFVRFLDSGKLCCDFQFRIARDVAADELRSYATDLEQLLEEAVNLSCSLEPTDGEAG